VECTCLFLPPASSAFPRTLSRSASRVCPSKRFHDGSPFRDCSHFVCSGPQVCSPPRSFLPACSLSPQGSRGFYVRAEHASLPPHASDMLTTPAPGNWWCGDLHPTRFTAFVGCSSVMAIYQQRFPRLVSVPIAGRLNIGSVLLLLSRSQGSGTSSGSSEDGVRASRLEHPRAARQPGACLVSELVLAARGHIRP